MDDEEKKIIPSLYIRHPETFELVEYPSLGVVRYNDAEVKQRLSALEQGKQEKGNYIDKDMLENGLIPISDKLYIPKAFSGYGRVNLPKNNGILNQDMMPLDKGNTIYIIQYDYSLNDQTIRVPENSILMFNGGSIKNGTLEGNQTRIANIFSIIYHENVNFTGSFIETRREIIKQTDEITI